MNPDILASQEMADLAAALYPELRRAARGLRAGHRVGGTLQTTALVNEAYLKLARSIGWESRRHFLVAAALAMRQVLIDAARARQRARRGDGRATLSIDDVAELAAIDVRHDEQLLELADALERLAQQSPRWARVVECRYFGGYTDEQIAEALGITDRTARRDWIKARAWLFRALGGDAALPD